MPFNLSELTPNLTQRGAKARASPPPALLPGRLRARLKSLPTGPGSMGRPALNIGKNFTTLKMSKHQKLREQNPPQT